MRKVQYLVINSEEEIFYRLEEINNIKCGLAQNILSRSELKKRVLKPLETVIVILFENGNTEVISAMDLEMYFDQCIGR